MNARLLASLVAISLSAMLARADDYRNYFPPETATYLEAERAKAVKEAEAKVNELLASYRTAKAVRSPQLAAIKAAYDAAYKTWDGLRTNTPLYFPELQPNELDVGRVGRMPAQGDDYFFEVESVLAKDSAVVHVAGYVRTSRTVRGQAVEGRPQKRTGKPFVVKGMDVSRFADGSKIRLDGPFIVSGTARLDSGTLYQVEPLDLAKSRLRTKGKP
jgi:hypothetical protein